MVYDYLKKIEAARETQKQYLLFVLINKEKSKFAVWSTTLGGAEKEIRKLYPNARTLGWRVLDGVVEKI